jgi:DNA-binding response OmpR family regulator
MEYASFVPSLRKKEYQVETVPTGSEAVRRLFEIDPDLVVVNAASLRSSGKRICNDIRAKSKNVPIVLILPSAKEDPEESIESANSQQAEAKPRRTRKNTPTQAAANVILELPFTSRKLLNRITPLLPGDGKNILHVGYIRLDLELKRVRCKGREARLTPRLTHLLQVLLLHAGEAVERQRLFSEVWETTYTGDTRTLDVHISWLREAIEANPRQPQFLKTIRGIGYRLDA